MKARLEKKGTRIELEEDALIIPCSTQNPASSERRFFDWVEAGRTVEIGFYEIKHPAIHLELVVDSAPEPEAEAPAARGEE